MNSEQHKNEIDQLKKHMKMLNITGGIAICALSLGGAFMFSDAFEPAVDTVEHSIPEQIGNGEQANAGETGSDVKSANKISVAVSNSDFKISENEIVSRNVKKAEVLEKSKSSKRVTTIDEELQSFDASCNEGSILFHWITQGGTKYAYEVEKTYDQLSYEVFVRAPQPSKIDGQNVYSVEETATSTDEAFYRLRKVLGKGKYEYSEAVKVKCSEKERNYATVDVFPNGNGSFRIMVNTNVAGTYKVNLSDSNDQELASEDFLAKTGTNEFILNSSSIVKGNYVLRVTNDSMVKERKVVLK